MSGEAFARAHGFNHHAETVAEIFWRLDAAVVALKAKHRASCWGTEQVAVHQMVQAGRSIRERADDAAVINPLRIVPLRVSPDDRVELLYGARDEHVSNRKRVEHELFQR